jgi:predicted amidohydrolase
MGDFPPYLNVKDCVEFGENRDRGNVIGIQAWMGNADYSLGEAFRAKLGGYMTIAQRKGWIRENSLIIFPEHIGTWLVAAEERSRVFAASTMKKAMRSVALANPLSLLVALIRARAQDRLVESLFRMKGTRMAEIYHETFSGLARSYKATIVAGSIVLPHARILQDRLTVNDGPLFNTTAVYRPDGKPFPDLVYKIHPTTLELPFIKPGAATDLMAYDTPVGRVGVLICADSWYADGYSRLSELGCDFLAVPNHLTPSGSWHKPWKGYSPGPEPAEIDLDDIGHIKEGEAWLKYGMASRLSQSGARSGMQVFLRGTLWDLDSDGQAIVVHEGNLFQGKERDGAAITNLWL